MAPSAGEHSPICRAPRRSTGRRRRPEPDRLKYMPRLALTDPGFDASNLSEFQTRLVAGGAEPLLFETLLTWCREHQLLKERGRQRPDSTHVAAAVRALNRPAVVAPEWLRSISQP